MALREAVGSMPKIHAPILDLLIVQGWRLESWMPGCLEAWRLEACMLEPWGLVGLLAGWLARLEWLEVAGFGSNEI